VIPKTIDFNYIKGALKRRFWHIVLPFFVVSLASITYCIKAPKIYRSSALILIQPQEVSTDYVKASVTSNIQSRVSTITDEIMSRSTLKDIIIRHDLYPQLRKSGSIHEAIKAARKNISLDFNARNNKRSETSFVIIFEGKNPTQVRNVTQELAELFIDYNFRLRAEQAAGTTQFLDRELERVKSVLREKEEEVRQFKEKNSGLLPEQVENNYRILSQLQQHLDSVNGTLQKTEDRKILLQNQVSKLKSLGEGGTTSAGQSGEPTSLEGLRQQLQLLQSRYSNRHPDVVKLKARIAKLETDLQTVEDAKGSGTTDGPVNTNETQRLVRFQREDRYAELSLIEKEISALRKEKEETEKQVEKYRERIEMGPKIEAMFVDLRRGYEQASASYQSLLNKKLQAQLAENLERTQKGEQFQLLDQAHLPRKPYKPNILKILGVSFILALGCGFGLAYLLESSDSTFWSRKEVESILDLPVLVSIPIITTAREKRWEKIKIAASICVLLIMSSSLLYALFILWKKNPGFLPIPL